MEWLSEPALVTYEYALKRMEAHVTAMLAGLAEEHIWLLEHEPCYTAGSSAKAADLLDAQHPVFETGRGGQYTYHGPGQRIAYTMLDLKARAEARGDEPDLRRFVWSLEEWLILTLAAFGVTGERREGRIGIWVETGKGEAKIAALGIRVRRWVSFHGVALNVNPDLSHYQGIVPCGIREYGVTSLAALGIHPTMQAVDLALQQAWAKIEI